MFVIALIVYFLAVEVFPLSRRAGVRLYDPESVRAYVQDHVSQETIKEYLKRLTAFDHVAGTTGGYSMAQYVEGQFAAVQLERLTLEEYQVYLNYPRPSGRRVAIVEPSDLAWEATLEEEAVYDPNDPLRKQTMIFHGYSRSGNVTGPLIYGNYGSQSDFTKLEEMSIDVKGAVVLVRYYGSQTDRALKVKAAEEAGAVGCIIYSDPQDDGFKKGKAWPDGPWMPSDGVQRGTVGLTSWVVGDPLTPGWASTQNAERVSKTDNPGLVNIPSLPLAWRDAQNLLKALKGHGKRVQDEWRGGVPNVDEWWTGDQDSPVVHLRNEQDEYDKKSIWNVVGQITGYEQSAKTIIVGNHRDAWCFGAADPGSGTAVLLEVVRILGSLKQHHWRPRRTIKFASWDGEEYNLVGSTEWVEDNLETLRANSMAYLNIDTAVSGQSFHAAGSPLFERALLRVLGRANDVVTNVTLRSIWEKSKSRLEGLGAGSDYVAFQDIAGTSSLDISFQGLGYPYHSCYDNFEWMEKFGDPDFSYHKLIAQVWALLILELADEPVLPFDFKAYASAVEGYVKDLRHYTDEKQKASKSTLDLTPLSAAAEQFTNNAAEFDQWGQQFMYDGVLHEDGVQAIHRMSYNARMANFDTHLLDLEDGGGVSTRFHSSLIPTKIDHVQPRCLAIRPADLSPAKLPNRQQYKNVLHAPQKWSGYDGAYFPGVRDAIDDDDWPRAQKQVQKAADVLSKASDKLLH
ncbi:MAG: hypothetical protein M1833_001265 [Piccolia ochrophora]|nr:MAG: hypothetical protein M1833_001265 [Piccolia ochrophora]